MEEKNIEKRASGDIALAVNGDIVQGYAAVFDSPAEVYGYVETIERGAITKDTVMKSDVFAVIEHDRYRGVLARSKRGVGSLTLKVDEKGLSYSFSVPETAAGKELKSYIERGEMDGSSFAFTVKTEEWSKKGDIYYRTIKEIDRLYDVSPVFSPAYSDTSVALRGLDEFKALEAENAKKQIELIEQEEKAREDELNDYYKQLNLRIKLITN